MEVYWDAQSHVEKRTAAYMILMRNPEDALVRDIVTSLQNERDEQLKSFVVSHMNNMLKSDKKEMNQWVKHYAACKSKGHKEICSTVYTFVLTLYNIILLMKLEEVQQGLEWPIIFLKQSFWL